MVVGIWPFRDLHHTFCRQALRERRKRKDIARSITLFAKMLHLRYDILCNALWFFGTTSNICAFSLFFFPPISSIVTFLSAGMSPYPSSSAFPPTPQSTPRNSSSSSALSTVASLQSPKGARFSANSNLMNYSIPKNEEEEEVVVIKEKRGRASMRLRELFY